MDIAAISSEWLDKVKTELLLSKPQLKRTVGRRSVQSRSKEAPSFRISSYIAYISFLNSITVISLFCQKAENQVGPLADHLSDFAEHL